jgi:hypothetical protein
MNDLNSVMHAAVDGAHPDMDRILSGALRQGTRRRSRRRVGYVGAGVAVAAMASLGAVTLGSHSGDTAREVAPAASRTPRATPAPSGPASTALQAGQIFHLGHRVLGTVVPCTSEKRDPVASNPSCILPAGVYQEAGHSDIRGTGTGFALVLTGPSDAVEEFWTKGLQSPLLAGYHGLTYVFPADSPLVKPVYQGQAVAIHVPGWKQVGAVADDKQSLEGPGGAMADIVWRPASERAGWVTDSDKGANASTWTSPVHHGVFVTIQAGPGTSDAAVQALGASLTWD